MGADDVPSWLRRLSRELLEADPTEDARAFFGWAALGGAVALLLAATLGRSPLTTVLVALYPLTVVGYVLGRRLTGTAEAPPGAREDVSEEEAEQQGGDEAEDGDGGGNREDRGRDERDEAGEIEA